MATEPDKVVMTAREGEPPPTRPEVIILKWWQQALIRGSRVYLQSLVGFLLAAGTGAAAAVGVNLPVGDFGKLLLSAGSMAVAPAVISLLQNSIEILSKLDSSNPQVRA